MYMYLGTGPAAQVPDERSAAGDRRFLLHDQEPVRGVQVLPTVSGQGASHHCPAIRRHHRALPCHHDPSWGRTQVGFSLSQFFSFSIYLFISYDLTLIYSLSLYLSLYLSLDLSHITA